MATIEYLESERQKIWERITELQGLIEKKTSDYEKEATQASKKCSEFKNKCEATKNEANSLLTEIKGVSAEINKSKVITLIKDIESFHAELSTKKEVINTQIVELEELFEEHDTYKEKLEALDVLANSADDYSTKLDTIYKLQVERKKEIDELYSEVFGFTDVDATTGKETKIEGLKDKLDVAYAELTKNFEAFSVNKNKEFNATLNSWKTEYSSALQKVRSLLPDALTGGLSYAYSKKKNDELFERAELSKELKKYINILIGISTIPFLYSIYLIYQGDAFEKILSMMPKFATAIVPLYAPVLWMAISANRKINLSKRLIEEYTHKEVVTKTFEGLSRHIEDIEDTKASKILKTKLLTNLLDINAENPGKLILDYNKSDHPIASSKIGQFFDDALKEPIDPKP